MNDKEKAPVSPSRPLMGSTAANQHTTDLEYTSLLPEKQKLIQHAVKILQEALDYDGTTEMQFSVFLNDNNHKNIVSLSIYQDKAKK